MRSLEEVRGGRPREVVVARRLAIAASVLWMPLLGYLAAEAQLSVLLLVLYVFGAFGAVKGRHAARILMTVAAALLAVLLLPYAWLGFGDPYANGPAYAVMDVVALLLAAASIVQVYLPASARYFHLVAVARRTGPNDERPAN